MLSVLLRFRCAAAVHNIDCLYGLLEGVCDITHVGNFSSKRFPQIVDEFSSCFAVGFLYGVYVKILDGLCALDLSRSITDMDDRVLVMVAPLCLILAGIISVSVHIDASFSDISAEVAVVVIVDAVELTSEIGDSITIFAPNIRTIVET